MASRQRDRRRVLGFDGDKDYVDVGTRNVDYSQGFTVEAWVLYESYNNWSRIIDFGNGPNKSNIILANITTQGLLVFYIFRAANKKLLYSQGLEKEKWIHLAASVTPEGEGSLYVDGETVATGESWTPAQVSRTKCYVGRSNYENDEGFHGQMCEVRVWSRARTADEIRSAMAHRLTGSEEGLAGYWPFDEGEGETAHDKSSQGSNGTIHGATWAEPEGEGLPESLFAPEPAEEAARGDAAAILLCPSCGARICPSCGTMLAGGGAAHGSAAGMVYAAPAYAAPAYAAPAYAAPAYAAPAAACSLPGTGEAGSCGSSCGYPAPGYGAPQTAAQPTAGTDPSHAGGWTAPGWPYSSTGW